MKQFGLVLMLFILSESVMAEWVRIGESTRSVAYAEKEIRRSGDIVVMWILFDYKSLQESSISEKKYLSEIDQREINCRTKQGRVLFFTWHAEPLGNGAVVYTGKKTTDWEPFSPNSFGNASWNFACNSK